MSVLSSVGGRPVWVELGHYPELNTAWNTLVTLDACDCQARLLVAVNYADQENLARRR